MAALSGSQRGISSKAVELVIEGISFAVFAVLDIVDQLLCPVFALLDSLLDSSRPLTSCYCRKNVVRDGISYISQLGNSTQELNGKKDSALDTWRRSSQTVYGSHRKAGGRSRLHLVPLHRILSGEVVNSPDACEASGGPDVTTEAKPFETSTQEHGRGVRQEAALFSRVRSKLHTDIKRLPLRIQNERRLARWSDCGCEKCSLWRLNDQHLHVHLDDKDFVASPGISGLVQSAENNVIFLHGFLSSSAFWTDSVIPALPQDIRANHRLFAVDILGFGKSPKPANCTYTLADHLDSIQRSLLKPYGIQKFHLVAHSMGCIIALALAAQFPAAVKSITLLALPYFPPAPGITPGVHTMHQVAPRRIWPLMSFGSAVMSWYEHIGRVVCLVVCKNHRLWEPLLLLLHSRIPGDRVPISCVTNFTQHTHHSAWHLFHNTICVGADATDYSLKVLSRAGRRVRLIHGTEDSVIPLKQSEMLSCLHPNVLLTPVLSANHASVVWGRESELGLELAEEFKLADNALKTE